MLVPALDMSKPPGQRLSPELAAELAIIAPSTLLNEGVTTAKIRGGAVTEPKLAPGAVTSTKIATGGVEAVNLADGAVTPEKISAGAVTNVAAGPGVMTVFSADGSPRTCKQVFLTSAEYDALEEYDPNTVYDLTD